MGQFCILFDDPVKPPVMRQGWGMPGTGRGTAVHSWLKPVLEAGLLCKGP